MKKYQCVLQDDNKDCGVSCLLSIIRYYGGDASKEYLRDITNTTKDGVDAWSLMQGANSLGFNTKGVEGDVFELDDHMLPCIAHVIIKESYKHFCVINKIDRKNKVLTLSDPAQGIVKIKYTTFKKISTNKFILLLPKKTIPKFKKDHRVLEIVLNVFANQKKELLTLFICSITYTILNIIIAFYFQIVIENGINYEIKENIQIITIVTLFFILVKEIMNYFRSQLISQINCKMEHTMICDIFNHILSLPYLYYKNRTTGEIVSRVNDLSEIKEYLTRIFITFFVDFLLFFFVLITLITISETLTLTLILIFFIYSGITLFFDSYLTPHLKSAQKSIIERNSYLIEAISSNATIKGLNIKTSIYYKFLEKYNKSLNKIYNVNTLNNISVFLKGIIENSLTIILLFIGSNFVIQEKMTLSQLITYHGLLFYFLDSIKGVLNLNITIKRIKIIIERVEDLYKIEMEKMENKRKKQIDIKGKIECKKLNFAYGSKEILRNINITIKTGEKIMLYGGSGNGKSTLMKILMGYLKIKRNMVFIDDKDINDYKIDDIREQIGYISQDEFLFTDSIYNNITVGKKNCDIEEFLNVCKITKVDEIINKNVLGYNELLEENAVNISGGEKQRIILARLLLRQRKIYILDEAFSEIDIETERTILKNIFKTFKDITFIFISHRFNNNDLFDRVIELGK